MPGKEFIGEIIRNPPRWFIAILVAVLIAHAFKSIVMPVIKTGKGTVIAALELILAVVLGYIVLERYISGTIDEHPPQHWLDHPLLVAGVFCAGIISSVWIYDRSTK